ncbi:MAG: IPT/TIG domain-containing protein [Dehalococcoidales bacterium]|nr:IPT/TIG domain-containing protein [Dehalococcoidales bacterium]
MLKKRILGLVLALALTALLAVPAGAAESVASGEVGGTVTVTGISPSYGAVDPTVSVVITGTGFILGGVEASSVEVSDTGVTAAITDVVDANTINADFTIAAGAASGPRNVSVTVDGVTGTGNNLFVVDGSITVNPPATIPLGALIPNTTETGNIALTNMVSTNLIDWEVSVKDNINGGFLKDGDTSLSASNKFQIGATAGVVDSDTGFNYTEEDGTSPTLYWSQAVPAEAAPGTYSITLTFTASAP